jgi:hypothetical protein
LPCCRCSWNKLPWYLTSIRCEQIAFVRLSYAPRRGAPTPKTPLIFPDCIRVQKGRTPPSLPPTQRMSRKTTWKIDGRSMATLKNVGHASNENYSYMLLHTTQWWNASS